MKITGPLKIIGDTYHQIERTRTGEVIHKTEITVQAVKGAKEYLKKIVDKVSYLEENYIMVGEVESEYFIA
jgi:hypothetical protein